MEMLVTEAMILEANGWIGYTKLDNKNKVCKI